MRVAIDRSPCCKPSLAALSRIGRAARCFSLVPGLKRQALSARCRPNTSSGCNSPRFSFFGGLAESCARESPTHTRAVRPVKARACLAALPDSAAVQLASAMPRNSPHRTPPATHRQRFVCGLHELWYFLLRRVARQFIRLLKFDQANHTARDAIAPRTQATIRGRQPLPARHKLSPTGMGGPWIESPSKNRASVRPMLRGCGNASAVCFSPAFQTDRFPGHGARPSNKQTPVRRRRLVTNLFQVLSGVGGRKRDIPCQQFVPNRAQRVNVRRLPHSLAVARFASGACTGCATHRPRSERPWPSSEAGRPKSSILNRRSGSQQDIGRCRCAMQMPRGACHGRPARAFSASWARSRSGSAIPTALSRCRPPVREARNGLPSCSPTS